MSERGYKNFMKNILFLPLIMWTAGMFTLSMLLTATGSVIIAFGVPVVLEIIAIVIVFRIRRDIENSRF